MHEFDVYVRPGAKRPSIGGLHDGLLVVRTAAQPIDGRANDAVQRAIADALNVRVSAVSIVRGATARRKRIRVEGDSPAIASRVSALRATDEG